MAESTKSPETTVLITRELDAPRSLVFEPWSTAEHLSSWFGPRGFTSTCTVDFRPGGATRITMRGYGMESSMRGIYLEIIRPERIVWSFRFDDVPDHEILTTITFAEAHGKTTVTVQQVFPAWDHVNAAHQALLRPRFGGSQEGWSQTLQHLAEFVAARAGALPA